MPRDPIVAGTDGSPSAKLAVDKAGELAQALETSVHVVSAYSSTSSAERMAAAGGVAVAEKAGVEQAQKAAEKIVAEARDRLQSWGIGVQTHVCSGEPAQALIAVAEAEHAQMIVVGNRGMTGVRRLLGSVPNRVSHHAQCGVLIVPTQLRSRPGGPSLKGGSIVVGTDGSAGATRAVTKAIDLAKALGAELHIVSSYKPLRRTRVSGAPESGAEVQAPLPESLVESVLDQAAATARARGVDATIHALKEDPADALLGVAATADAAMIVVGSKGMHGAEQIRLGNVPNQISHKGLFSVLIVLTSHGNSTEN
jgi:nucleotide-binding universal stress UspA family protein